MSRTVRAALAAYLLLGAASALAATADYAVSAQGRLLTTDVPGRTSSPSGTWRVEIAVTRAGWQLGGADLVVSGPAGERHHLRDVDGSAFLIGDTGRLVAVTDMCDGACPTRVRVLDQRGRELAAYDVAGLTDPVLSSDGISLVYRHRNGVTVLNLTTLAAAEYPLLATFAAGPGGLLAGVTPDVPSTLLTSTGGEIPLGFTPQRLAFSRDSRWIYAIGGQALAQIELATGSVQVLYAPPAGTELRDLRCTDDGVVLGLRRDEGGVARGEFLTVAPDGRVLARTEGPVLAAPQPADGGRTHEAIPWPLAPAGQHEVGNTYGEYQNYGSSYLHPGVDVMGSPGQPVYAVKADVVKAILTTSGEYHWRIAVGAPGAGTTEGYLYAHVDEPTITVSVGQSVSQGQYLGNLVPWPVADFEHCHFARIRDTGTQWQGLWLCIDNPHPDLPSTEMDWPVFEPAVANQTFAFCNNETAVYQNPTSLHGAVDIIAHVGDLIAGNWVCSVQEIRYTIFPLGHPDQPVVDNKLAVRFDMALDTYSGGPIDPLLVGLLYKQDAVCNSLGDYDAREFFHIVTNSDGDEVYQESDRWQAWDTSTLLDRQYVVRVNVRDAKGNSASASMTVTTINGNLPTSVDGADLGPLTLGCAPNPGPAGTRASFRLPAASPARLSVYDLAGRRLRQLVSEDLAAGPHSAAWDGRDETGTPCPAGTYLLRLESRSGVRTEKFALIR